MSDREDDPLTLNNRAWEIAKTAGKNRGAYHTAPRLAEAACRLAPDNGLYTNTLGVAQYRIGEFERALTTLHRSDKLNSETYEGGHPADVAFIAMSLHQLGRTEEARAALDRLRALMQDGDFVDDAESQAFLREAESLITGEAASDGTSE